MSEIFEHKTISVNQEQLAAIEHKGGVLLEAGAGSGKTFVIVQHLLYKTKIYFDNYKAEDSLERKVEGLKSLYSSLVVLSFTREAAGELENRIKNCLYNWPKDDEKNIIIQAVSYLNVQTIHGFCHKLIAQGFIKDISPEANIVDEWDIERKIESILNDWITRKIKKRENCDSIIEMYDDFVKSLSSIYCDVTTRSSWLNYFSSNEKLFENMKTPEIVLDEVIAGIFQYEPGASLFYRRVDLSVFSEIKIDYEDDKVYLFLRDLYSLIPIQGQMTWGSFLKINTLFLNTSRLPSCTLKKYPENLVAFWEKIKKIKDFCKKTRDDFDNFVSDFIKFKEWALLVKEIFFYIEKNYLNDEKISFSDLEYYVYRFLNNEKNNEILKEIRKKYRYFVIDEFQDTSKYQFDLLKILIGDDRKKLFCVGDLKQSIYGFRGGEWSVFKECQNYLPQVKFLLSNYRSNPEIVEFNNKLFEDLFKKDDFTFKPQIPCVASTFTEDDGLICWKLYSDSDIEGGDYSPAQLDKLEALGLIRGISHLVKEEKKILVLYKKRSPLPLLIEQLIRHEIPFSASLSVKYSEDPLFNIFKILLEAYLSGKYIGADLTSIQYRLSLFFDNICLNEKVIIHEENLKKFFDDLPSIGCLISFKMFFYSLNLSNSLYYINMDLLEKIISTGENSLSKIWKILVSHQEDTYRFKYQYGKDPLVSIMTVHGAKGLEFDHVFLAGIYSNGDDRFSQSEISKSFLGKLPLSGKFHGISSPYLFLEKIDTKFREKQENRRLFYVATTRAKKSLNYVLIDDKCFDIKKKLESEKDSWINFLYAYSDKSCKIRELRSSTNQDISNDFQLSKEEFSLLRKDSMGLLLSENSGDYPLTLVPELSVTSLAQIWDCPRRFYLSNILKYDKFSLDFFSENMERNLSPLNFPKDAYKSNSDTGTEVHKQIERMIGSSLGSSDYHPDFRESLRKLSLRIQELKKKNCLLVSEKQLKFSFGNTMISASPDLYILDKNLNSFTPEIWDFKTGKKSEFKEKAYWFQLKAYAYALYQTGVIPTQSEVILKLVYLNGEDLSEFSQKTSFISSQEALKEAWGFLKDYHKQNLAFCSFCEYKNICHSV